MTRTLQDTATVTQDLSTAGIIKLNATTPIATSGTVGTVKPGSGLSVAGDGTLSTSAVSNSGIINVKDYGATGNGSTDDTAAIQSAFDAAFGPVSSPHGSNAPLNSQIYFPPGTYIISSPIQITKVLGGIIQGAGRFVTTIKNMSGGSVFVTNGMGYSQVRSMRLYSNGASVIFDLDWDGNNSGYGGALQSNTFSDMHFDSGTIGLQIGNSGFMGSETLVQNCFFVVNSIAGIKTCNFNAVANTMIGGDFQDCGIGIWARFGAFTTVHGVSFQGQVTYDIQVDNSADDTMSVSGCRSESNCGFIKATSIGLAVNGCSLSGGPALTEFVNAAGCRVSINGCDSLHGQLVIKGSSLSVNGFTCGRDDWLVFQASVNPTSVLISGVKTTSYSLFDWSTTYAMLPTDIGYVTGLRGLITDANVSTWGSTVSSGGGGNIVPIYSDGTNWRVG